MIDAPELPDDSDDPGLLEWEAAMAEAEELPPLEPDALPPEWGKPIVAPPVAPATPTAPLPPAAPPASLVVPGDPWHTITPAAMWAARLTPVDLLVPEMDLGRGRPCGLVGAPNAGKNDAAQSLALAVASGRPAWGKVVARRGRVLHLTWDMGDYATILRYRRLANGMGCTFAELAGNLEICDHPIATLCAADAEKAFVARCKGFDLVLVDNLRSAAPDGDENSSEFGRYVVLLGVIAARTHATVLYLHHTGKDGQGQGRGTGAIQAASGAIWRIEGRGDEPRHLTQERKHDNSNREHPDFWVKREELPPDAPFDTAGEPSWRDTWCAAKPPKSPAAARSAAVAAFVKANPGCGADAIRRAVKGKAEEVDAAVASWVEKGRIEDLGTREERAAKKYHWVETE